MAYGNDTENGKARMAFCAALPAALKTVTGDEWEGREHAHSRDSHYPENEPAGFRGLEFVRVRDGFTVRAWASWANDNPHKMRATVSWPRGKRDGVVRYRDMPGVSYSAKEPETCFDPLRKPETVAKQIARVLLTVEHAEAFARGMERLRQRGQDANDAVTWRDRVQEASGIPARVCDNGGGPRVTWQYDAWARLESSHDLPGGKLALELPTDPEEAARVVAAVRAAMGK